MRSAGNWTATEFEPTTKIREASESFRGRWTRSWCTACRRSPAVPRGSGSVGPGASASSRDECQWRCSCIGEIVVRRPVSPDTESRYITPNAIFSDFQLIHKFRHTVDDNIIAYTTNKLTVVVVGKVVDKSTYRKLATILSIVDLTSLFICSLIFTKLLQVTPTFVT